jgi:hypothetical protein
MATQTGNRGYPYGAVHMGARRQKAGYGVGPRNVGPVPGPRNVGPVPGPQKNKRSTRQVKPDKKTKPEKQENKLGQGAYGMVTMDGDYAVKHFKKQSHLVQETIAGVFLYGQKHVVEFVSADFDNITLRMKCYPTTLRKWSNDAVGKPMEYKDKAARQLLLGLINIHKLHLVHGDIKPGNILVVEEPFYLAIADLGFISLQPYSKCERTAAVYRDTNVKSCHGHDVYSAGIILLELYGDIKISEQATPEQLHEAIDEQINHPGKDQKCFKLRKVLKKMTHKDHEKRPSAADVYFELFGEKIQYPKISGYFEADKHYYDVRAIMKKLSDRHEIIRANRGYKALCNYIVRNEEIYEKHGPKACAASMTFVLSSVFGRFNNFNEKAAADYAGCSKKVIIDIASRLCLDTDVVHYLMTP